MIYKNIKLVVATLALVFTSANASLITFETRDLDHSAVNHGVNKNDYANSWLAQTSLIESTSLTEFTRMNSGRDSFSHLKIDLTLVNDVNNWVFEFGLDAGFGAALYLDGQFIQSRTDDLWWSKSWSNRDVFSVGLVSLGAKNQFLDIYWAEHCCDGYSSIRFKNDKADWSPLSVANLYNVGFQSERLPMLSLQSARVTSVSEPTSLALAGVAFLGLAYRSKRTQININH
jgi:hypothetical protein